MRAVIFTRVSTANQADSGLGLSAQQTEIEAFIRRQGWTVVAEHTEAGVSGKTPLHGRTGLSNALNDVEVLNADVLLVSKLDRLSRDFLVQLVVEQRLEKAGARLVSVAGEGTNSDSPSDVLIRRLFSSISEMNGRIISERTKQAIAEKLKRGERFGASPFGFSVKEGQLLPDEHYESILLMFQLLKENNQTRTAEILNEQTDYKSWSQVKVSNLKRKWRSRTRLRNFRDSLIHPAQ
jgi:site-specific DNA recombinase|tara:strand:- start:8 stop:718 length:711 start_codon:yes stop_codon:yes gene_type:complete